MSKKKSSPKPINHLKETTMAVKDDSQNEVNAVEQAIADIENIQHVTTDNEVSATIDIADEETPVVEESPEPVENIVPVVEEAPIPVKEPVVEETPAPIVTDKKPIESNDNFDIQIGIIKETGTTRQKYLIDNIESYIETMKPGKPIANETGAKMQFKLWQLIKNIVDSSSNEEFNKLWYIILAYFLRYQKEVFGDRYVFRFSEYWIWSQNDLSGLQRIINLIKVTCDINKMADNIKLVDINRSLEHGFTPEGRQRLISFYKR